ncbi:hypothetical protein D3C71_1563050 [compost metagenome]
MPDKASDLTLRHNILGIRFIAENAGYQYITLLHPCVPLYDRPALLRVNIGYHRIRAADQVTRAVQLLRFRQRGFDDLDRDRCPVPLNPYP